MRPYKLTAEREAILRARWADPFVSRKTIARELRIATDTLREWVVFLDLPKRASARKPPAAKTSGHRLVVTMMRIAAAKGMGAPQIAERAGYSLPAVWKWQAGSNPTVPAMEAAVMAIGGGYRLEIVDASGQVVT